jgi:putative SOS response-associated peptidase YedK
MCYDISFTTDMEEVTAYLPDLVPDGQLSLEFDTTHVVGHAFGQHPIIYRHRDDQQLHCRLMEWGCIPFYVKEEKKFVRQRASMLNARSERILGDDKSYWYKIRNRRCLIPVTGIYEHRAIKGWKNKVPYFIRLKQQPVFFIPGLYSVVELPDTSTGEMISRWTYTLVTRDANTVMSQIHNSGENKGRMPLMLPREWSLAFLDEDLSENRYKEILHYEMASEEMEYYPVFTIRSPRQRPDLAKKNIYWEWANLPELGTQEPEENN